MTTRRRTTLTRNGNIAGPAATGRFCVGSFPRFLMPSGRQTRNPLPLDFALEDSRQPAPQPGGAVDVPVVARSLDRSARLAACSGVYSSSLRSRFPVYLHVTTSLLIHPRGIPWTSHFWSVWGDVRTNTAQVALSLIVSTAPGLPDD
mgnify:CR=1 FL=1